MCFRTARFYRTFHIPKRSGGIRRIDVPAPSLAIVQRWLAGNVISKLPVDPDSAVAYQLGLSIKNHVYPHAGKPYLLKMDIAAFFPSISVFSVANLLKRHGYDHSLAMTMAHLLTLRGTVPQGAPSSPALSNAVFLLADTAIKEYCQKRNLTYTRYADDIAISGSEIDDEDILVFIAILKEHGFQSNEGKRRLFRPGSRGRLLTGLVINGNDIRVPKATRRKIRHSVHVLEKYLFSDLGLEAVVGEVRR